MFSQEFWDLVDKEVEAGYINVNKHPTEDLWIYNYTNQAMFDGRWNEATMVCRGLIVDGTKKVRAWPFLKFFTKEQAESYGLKIPYGESFSLFDKVDGSLGVMYWIGSRMFLATRGSFVSDQAVEANKILEEKYADVYFDPNITYLFEIIYPENRIVVDYGKKRDLVLLGMIDTSNGKEIPLSEAPSGLNLVTEYHGVTDFSKVLNQFENLSGTEFEGLVLRFESGFRVKFKTEDYKKLHKIYTGLSERDIWDCLSSGIGVEEIVKTAPDEMFDWIKQVVVRLKNDFAHEESLGKMLYLSGVTTADERYPKSESSSWKKEHAKEFALFVLKCPDKLLQGIAFAMYRGFSHDKMIWESLYPDGNKKFRTVSEIE